MHKLQLVKGNITDTTCKTNNHTHIVYSLTSLNNLTLMLVCFSFSFNFGLFSHNF